MHFGCNITDRKLADKVGPFANIIKPLPVTEWLSTVNEWNPNTCTMYLRLKGRGLGFILVHNKHIAQGCNIEALWDR